MRRTDDGIAIITVAGELDLYTAPRLKENLLAALEDDVLKIVVDMTGVHFIDSSALGVLIGGVKRLKPKGGRWFWSASTRTSTGSSRSPA